MSRWTVDFTPPVVNTHINFRDTASGLRLLGDIDGIDIPQVEFAEQELFDQQGSQLNQVRFAAREVTVPIAVFGPDAQTLRARCRALASAMNPRLGDGMLTLRADDGADLGKVLFCRYAKGFEGSLETFDIGDGWYALAPVFRAFDPYWYDAQETVINFISGGPGDITFFPMFAAAGNVGPHFGQSQVATGQTIANDGDDIVFPKWVIQGPISNMVLANLSTNQTMDFSANGGLVLADTDTVTIDPSSFPSIVDQTGRNLIPYLQPSSVPWALGQGVNRIDVTGTSVGAGSSVQLSYRQRWLAA